MVVGMKSSNLRDHIAFWIFGMSNSFAFIVMLTAAQDIMSDTTRDSVRLDEPNNVTNSATHCEPRIERRECRVEPLGAVLLCNVVPGFLIKLLLPFVLHRIPFGILHILVCISQAASYLIVANTTSVTMSLGGVVFAAISSGLGDICYLALASHYHRDTISSWSSGTGGSGILASLSYAALTEPHLLNLSPQYALLVMLIIPVQFFFTYFFLLTPALTVYSPRLCDPRTWIVPKSDQLKLASTTLTAKDFFDGQEFGYAPVGKPHNEKTYQTVTAGERMRTVLSLLKYILPLMTVYYADYVVNQGLAAFMVFDCAHGMNLSAVSQYRWIQVCYCIGSFIARSSTNFFQIPYFMLVVFPVLEICNAVFCFANSLYFFVPHIWMIFALIFVEGLVGGASYANTYYRIHKEVDPSVKEFSLAITTMSDVIGILAAGLSTLPIHTILCDFYASRP
ncbi:Battenin [Aphelenchoides fujianensis]|nr:Battenin [Aphelenchoides fujianensis]